MKSMLIAAASVGLAVAGLILYLRKSNASASKSLSGSDGSDSVRHISIHPQNAMG